MIVFCLPYAGGNAWAYRALEAELARVQPTIAAVGLELPGRGRRTQDPLVTSLEALADDVVAQVRARVAGSDTPFVFYGHSMGALLAYLAAHRLRAAAAPMPLGLVLTGCEAPTAQTPRQRHALPSAAFIDVLREMGGCPPEVLADRELLEYFEPVLRADFKAVETWRPIPRPPLDLPIAVAIGDDEEVDEAHAAPWRHETTGPFSLDVLPGHHFFIARHWPTIANRVAAFRRHDVQEPQLRS